MATDLSFVEYVCEQILATQPISYKKMFGEYALYSGGKVVALICDNQLFVKPTEAGRHFVGTIAEGAPYPGAKLYFSVNEKMDDAEWLSQLIRITEQALPLPKPKKPRAKTVKK